MEKLAHPGDFCPKPARLAYGKLQKDQAQPNLKKIGKLRAGATYQMKNLPEYIYLDPGDHLLSQAGRLG